MCLCVCMCVCVSVCLYGYIQHKLPRIAARFAIVVHVLSYNSQKRIIHQVRFYTSSVIFTLRESFHAYIALRPLVLPLNLTRPLFW